ncbi:hypothetical protein C8T65DRAFT_746597 [Cerioporus squamosus]|nr:hypothetical protein C8T65DRAFT_746597 [Cerioporus squamosus]
MSMTTPESLSRPSESDSSGGSIHSTSDDRSGPDSSSPVDPPTARKAALPSISAFRGRKRKIEKMPLMKFVIGGYAARNMLPASILPRPLNPVYVECDRDDPQDIPLAWYGIVWHGEVLLEYAKKQGWAVLSKKSKLGAYDIVPTWDRLRRHYYAKHRIALNVQDVWGEDADGIEKIRYAVFDTLTEMGYEPGEAMCSEPGPDQLSSRAITMLRL